MRLNFKHKLEKVALKDLVSMSSYLRFDEGDDNYEILIVTSDNTGITLQNPSNCEGLIVLNISDPETEVLIAGKIENMDITNLELSDRIRRGIY